MPWSPCGPSRARRVLPRPDCSGGRRGCRQTPEPARSIKCGLRPTVVVALSAVPTDVTVRYRRAVEKLRFLADRCQWTTRLPADEPFLHEAYVFGEIL
ncbi:MAG: DUF7711 family protein, partial [Pseudonocardiaceae bacterium]